MGKKSKKRKLASLRAPLQQQKKKSKKSKKNKSSNTITPTTTTTTTTSKPNIADVIRQLHLQKQILPYPSQSISQTIAQHVGGKCKIKHVNNYVLSMRQKKRRKRGLKPGYFYLLLHKPTGYTSMRNNPNIHTPRHPSCYDLFLHSNSPAVPHVGRLDVDTEGLLLFTDDGKLLEGLINDRNSLRAQEYNAKYGKSQNKTGTSSSSRIKVIKEYLVQVSLQLPLSGTNAHIDTEVLEKMRLPLEYENGSITRPANVTDVTEEATFSNNRLYQILEQTNGNRQDCEKEEKKVGVGVGVDDGNASEKKWLRVRIDQGKNRQVRRLCARENLIVHRLVRVAVGPVHMGMLPCGSIRSLTKEELNACYSMALPGVRIPEMLSWS